MMHQKRLSAEDLAALIQQEVGPAKRTVESLVEAGLVEAHGKTRGRAYTLSAAMYKEKGDKIAYIRQMGFSKLQNEQMVLSHAQHHGRIQRQEVIELCHLGKDQANRLLKKLRDNGQLEMHGTTRNAYYTIPTED